MAGRPYHVEDPFSIDLPPGYLIDEETHDEKLYDRVLTTLQRRQRAMRALGQLISEAQAYTGGVSEGTDGTGTVRAVVAADGMPQAITVDPEWRRRVGADGFAAAVTQACAVATTTGIGALASLNLDGLVKRADDFLQYLSGNAGPPAGLHEDASDTRASDGPRWTAEVADFVLADLAAYGAVDRPGDPAEQRCVGSAEHGRLTLTFGGETPLRCDADPDWVGRQSTDDLNSALTAAVRSLVDERESRDAALSRALAAPTAFIDTTQDRRSDARGQT
jgi:hypothetical protein